MQIHIGPIRAQKGGELPLHFKENWSDIKRDGQHLGFVGLVEFSGKIGWTGESFLLRGRAEAEIEVECARCLKPNTIKIQSDILEEFLQTEHEVEHELLSEELEDADEWADEDVQWFSGSTIDLGEVVLENLLLAVPIKPLCSQDCPGLCPKCGHDLQQGDCGCEIEDINPGMEILRTLLDSD
ncbi:MAG: DUF177 domain-containing protein [Firmicutes bacterium]|nr:DUF177 domain-containing protein [Bacillota bacterium]